jgi:hypothetical protein
MENVTAIMANWGKPRCAKCLWKKLSYVNMDKYGICSHYIYIYIYIYIYTGCPTS